MKGDESRYDQKCKEKYRANLGKIKKGCGCYMGECKCQAADR